MGVPLSWLPVLVIHGEVGSVPSTHLLFCLRATNDLLSFFDGG